MDNQILQRLKDKVRATRDWRDRAQRDLDQVTKHGSGLPAPVVVLWVDLLGRKYDRAIHAAQKALTDYSEFLITGRAPEDLEKDLDID